MDWLVHVGHLKIEMPFIDIAPMNNQGRKWPITEKRTFMWKKVVNKIIR